MNDITVDLGKPFFHQISPLYFSSKIGLPLAKLEKYYNSSFLGSLFCSFFQDEKSLWPYPQEVPTYTGNSTTVYFCSCPHSRLYLQLT